MVSRSPFLLGCCIHVSGPRVASNRTLYHQLRLMALLSIVSCWAHVPIMAYGLCVYGSSPLLSRDPGRGAAIAVPASHSQAGVKSSGKALKGKCFSDVGPEIALPFPKLITSCVVSSILEISVC